MSNRIKGIKSCSNLSELIKKDTKQPNLFNNIKSKTDLDIDNNNMNTNMNNNMNTTNNNRPSSAPVQGYNINYLETIRRLIAKESNVINNSLMFEICKRVSPIFENEPQLLELSGSIYICGDIHGQFDDLLKIFRNIGYPPKSTILFLGDYVDRGDSSLEVITLLFLLKIKYPKHIYMTRGNHECHTINMMYGFYEECQKKANIMVWKACNKVFSMLPLAATIDKKIFCVHGGISSKLEDIKMINMIKKGTKVPDNGILCDLMWADPGDHKEEWMQSDRGCSYTFNDKAVKSFMSKNNIDLICRAHQCVDGYEFSFGHKLVTVFSAPNYCGEYANAGAVMKVDKDLTCSFVVLRPVAYLLKNGKKTNIMKHIN